MLARRFLARWLVGGASLDRVGIHAFDGVPVLNYAISPELSPWVTTSYSYRLMMNFGAGSGHPAYLKNIRRPAAILVGSADEQELADQFTPYLQSLDVDIPITIVPGMKHADMIDAPGASTTVVRAVVSPE